MKSLICSILLILSTLFLQAQTTTNAYPIKQGVANSHTTEAITNAMYGKFIIYSYADTTAANADPYIKHQAFAFISTTSPIALWYRDLTNTVWVQVSVSGSPTVNAWLTRGNDLSTQSLPNRLGTKNGDLLNIITSDQIRAIIPAGGIVRSSSAQNRYLMQDTVGKELYYGDGGIGGIPISSLTAATAANTIDNTNYKQEWQWNTIAGGSGLKLSTTSTAAASNAQTLLEINLSGANAASSQTTHGAVITNTHTGTSSTNVGVETIISGGDQNVGFQSTVSGSAAWGVYSITSGTSSGRGVYGIASATGASNSYGVFGESRGNSGIGVVGSNNSTGYGGYFTNSGASGTGYALYAQKSGAATTNYAAYFTASQATNNYALFTSNGDILLNQASGTTTFGLTGTLSGIFNVSGSSSGLITFQPQAAAGTYNWNWPTTAGTSGYFLTSGGGGSTAMTWTQNNFLTGLTVGTTTIASGTTTRILYDNAGVLGEYTLTGTGTVVAMQTAPTFITSITSPLIIGGTGTTSTLTYKTTTGAGDIGADHIFLTGNNGGTEAMRILNSGNIGIGTATPNSTLHVSGSLALKYTFVEDDNYAITELDYTLSVNNTSNNWTIVLPDATTCAGRVYIIKRFDNNSTGTITVDAAGSNVQSPATGSFNATFDLTAWGTQNQSVMFQSNGTNWEAIK